MPRKLLIVDESPAAKSMGSVKDKKKKRVLQIVDEDGKDIDQDYRYEKGEALDNLREVVGTGYANAREFNLLVENMPFTNKKIAKTMYKLGRLYEDKWYDVVEKYLKIPSVTDDMEEFMRMLPNWNLNTYGHFAENFGFEVVGSGRDPKDYRATKDNVVETKDMLYDYKGGTSS